MSKINLNLVLITLLVVFLFGNLSGCFFHSRFVPPCHEGVTVIYDTVYLDTMYIRLPIATTVRKVKPNKSKVANVDSMHCDTLRIFIKDVLKVLPDTCIYSDTLRAHNDYKLILTDTVVGSIIGRGVWFANLRPEVTKTVTKTIDNTKKWTLYASLQIPIRRGYVSAIPTATVTTPIGFSFGYGYDIRGMNHVPSLGYALKFK